MTNSVQIRTKQGKKNERGNDRIIMIKVDSLDWVIITNDDILKLVNHVFANEDVIYPRPKFKGSGMFFDEIVKLYAKRLNTKNDTIARYQ